MQISQKSKYILSTILIIVVIELISTLSRKAGYEGRELVFYLRWLGIITIISICGFRSRLEWIKNLTLSIVSVSVVLLLVDFIFFVIIVIKLPAKTTKAYPETASFVEQDHNLGYVPLADTSINVQEKYDTLTVYNIRFTTDKYHRRINPFDTSKSKNRYALFFGCSITFGEGVNDSETIPSRFSYYLPAYHSYNFGFSGYGTQQMLANFQNRDIKHQITEKEGIGIYTFINPHINRAIGDMQVYDSWGANMPYYHIKGDSLFRNGSFKTGRWFISGIYTLLGRSSLLKYYKINFPLHLKERHFMLVTKMIKESYNRYVSKFGNTNFYVIIFPGEQPDIVPYLMKQHIKVLDYSKLFNRTSKGNSYLPFDGHPRPVADDIFAKQLSSDIKKLLP